MRKPPAEPLWLAMAAATIVYLGLMSHVPLIASGYAVYDDALFVKLADHIARGEWLGPFDELTLSKGPFFPIWIAVCHGMRLPLTLSLSLIQALAGWIFVAALRTQVRRDWLFGAVFVVFLFDPLAFNLENLRVVREGLYAPLTALAMASAAWWLVLQERRGWRPWFCSAASGVVLAALWLIREEALEIVPALLVLTGAAVFRAWRLRAGWIRPVLLAVAVAATASVSVGSVGWLNHRKYGLWDVVDFKQKEYRAAYGALSRVLPEPRQKHVPVSQEALARAAQTSPAFGRLWPLFNPAWAQHGCWMDHMDSCDGELRGGWFRYSLRDAAARAGFYGSAQAARDCYRRIADEVNTACADGHLSCLPPRETWVPPWRARYAAQTVRSLAKAAYTLVFLPTLDIHPGFSDDGKDFSLFHKLIRGPFFPLKDRWTLQGEVVMDALLDAHAMFISGGRTPLVTLQQTFGPLDMKHTHILFTLSSDCWDDSGALALQGRQGVLARIPAPDLIRGREFGFGRLRVLVKDVRRQDMAVGYDTSRVEGLFRWLSRLGTLYRVIIPPIFLLALICYARSLLGALRGGGWGASQVLSTALLVAIFSRLILYSFIDVTSWPAVNLLYSGPGYLLLIFFCGTAVLGVLE